MAVLQLNRKFLRFVGVFLERDATQREVLLSAFANVFVLTLFFMIIEYSAMYFYRNLERKLADAIFSLMPIGGFLALTGTYVSFIFNKYAIADFYDELEEFMNESMYNIPGTFTSFSNKVLNINYSRKTLESG